MVEEVEDELRARLLLGETLERVEVCVAKREETGDRLIGEERVLRAAGEALGAQEPPPLLPDRSSFFALPFWPARSMRTRRLRTSDVGGESIFGRAFTPAVWA